MVAVLVVILDHLVGWPSGGFVGVDIFFVISGFLITGLLLREHDKTGTISFTSFYRNRVRRIAPAATLVLAATVAAAAMMFNSSRFVSTIQESVWAFFFAANWNFAAAGTDYFQAAGPQSPLQHFWSLAVEEQFYFVWPWIMLGIFAFVSRQTSWGIREARLLIGMILAVLTLASFVWALAETANAPTVAYFSTFSRAWELGVGALIAVLGGVFEKLPDRMRRPLAYAGLAGIVVALFVVTEDAAFPAPWALLPVLATGAIIIAGTGSHKPTVWVLSNSVAGYIGNISYSLYLWHFPVIVIFTSTFGNSPTSLAICALIFSLAAVYSYHLVEDPIRRSHWLSGKKKPGQSNRNSTGVSAYKLKALSLLALITLVVVGVAMSPPKPVVNTAVSPVALPSPSVSAAVNSPELTKLQNEIQVALSSPVWPNLNPSLDEVIAGPQAPDDVMWCGKNRVEEARCTWGDPNATKTIVTVGNSISMTYVAALRSAIGNADGWKLISYGMFGCPFGDTASLEGLSTIPDGCAERADEAVSAINRLKPTLVVMSGIQKYESAAVKLKEITAPVSYVFLPGTPVDKDIASCYSRVSAPADCVSKTSESWGYHEKKLATLFPAQGTFVNSLAWYCYEGNCPSFVGNIPTKLDASHITAQYAERLGPVIREAFTQQNIMS